MTDRKQILVIGATGNIGRHVVAGLHARGAAVRALTRFPMLAGLPDGVEVVAGDLTRPDSLRDAPAGVDAVFLLWPFLSAEGAPEVARAIAEHARHVVYVSAAAVDDARTPAENGVWGQVEDAVRRSGAEWTFLRPTGFATNTLEWAAAIRAGRPVRIPYPEAARSLIHERDIADVAVRILTSPGHRNVAYVLTGPAALTQAEQVRILGAAAGQPTRVEPAAPDEAREAMLAWGDADFADSAMAYFASLVDNPEPVTAAVPELTGRPARSFAEWATDHVNEFRPLSAAEVGERYADAFRAGRVDLALRLASPDMVRVAPLEDDGEPVERRGLADIMANGERRNRDVDIHGVTVVGPFLHGDQFAVRFTFDETHIPTGRRTTTAKMSVYTVAESTITREEVFYLDAP
jgi:uncharacterized protein YbjT (DUF2867 family)